LAKVLVVDANVQMRLLAKKLIETREDWQVSEAIDGHDAVAKVSELKPDLVVLDFAMPGLNGLQAADKISSTFPDMPIILYTFYGFDAMVAEAKKHGVREVIDKASSGDYLLQAIEKHLGKTSQSLELPIVEPQTTNPGTKRNRRKSTKRALDLISL
jgi:CheY-like chemotaxis protein